MQRTLRAIALLAILLVVACGKKEEPKPPTTAAEDVKNAADSVISTVQKK